MEIAKKVRARMQATFLKNPSVTSGMSCCRVFVAPQSRGGQRPLGEAAAVKKRGRFVGLARSLDRPIRR
jgi:hypothetical protein